MDYGIAIDRLRPGAKYLRYATYADLVETWADETTLPSDAELIAAYAEWVAEQEAEQIAAAHDAQVEADSYDDIVAIPDWAHWTEEQVLEWIDAHTSAAQVDAITNLPQAKIVLNDMATQLRALSRLCVALRNKVYPRLET
jgi:hypothetical protein